MRGAFIFWLGLSVVGFADEASYFPWGRSIYAATAQRFRPTELVVPLEVDADGARSGHIIVYARSKRKVERLDLQTFLPREVIPKISSTTDSLSQHATFIANRAVYLTGGVPKAVKEFNVKFSEYPHMKVTPLAKNRQLCVIYQSRAPRQGSRCAVLDVNTRRVVKTFPIIDDSTLALGVTSMHWINDRFVACHTQGRRYNEVLVLDLAKRLTYAAADPYRIAYFSVTTDRLAIFLEGEDGPRTLKLSQ